MKPFNLEKALAGEKVINRAGRKITGLKYRLHPLEDSSYTTYSIDGKYGVAGEDLDLFMAPVVVYRNLYKYDDGLQLGFRRYNSAAEGKMHANMAYVGTVEIEE